jgi:hypothetical protein
MKEGFMRDFINNIKTTRSIYILNTLALVIVAGKIYITINGVSNLAAQLPIIMPVFLPYLIILSVIYGVCLLTLAFIWALKSTKAISVFFWLSVFYVILAILFSLGSKIG